jgi:hypothetical protein
LFSKSPNFVQRDISRCDVGVILRIIWPNFLRTIWHIGATSCPTDHKAFGCRVDPPTNSFVTCSSQLISRIRRISDQNALQKSHVSSRESDDCLCQISSKMLCQIIRKVTECIWHASYLASHNPRSDRLSLCVDLHKLLDIS